jgi:hypothetical protein
MIETTSRVPDIDLASVPRDLSPAADWRTCPYCGSPKADDETCRWESCEEAHAAALELERS